MKTFYSKNRYIYERYKDLKLEIDKIKYSGECITRQMTEEEKLKYNVGGK